MLHQIGSGVLGPVFRTYDSQADKLVAVKVFRLDLLPEDVARLADGLRRLAGAPGFVAAGLENTSAYLATDYLAGETLDVALRHLAPAPLETALPILERAAALIDEAWSGPAAFGHGALHPRDIFVTPDTGDVAITGFGVVPALETLGVKPPIRRPYTAPERTSSSEDVAWDIRADIYSLAAIAHELLTGRRPAGPSEQDGALPSSMPAETRVHVRRVLSKALAESPAQRFSTAAEFVAALGDPSAMPEPSFAKASTFAPAGASADKPEGKPVSVPAVEPPALTLLPVVEPPSLSAGLSDAALAKSEALAKVDEFDLSHVIRQEPQADLLASVPIAGQPTPVPVDRRAKSRTVAMPVVKPKERRDSAANTPPFGEVPAGRPGSVEPEQRFRSVEPELIRTPAPDFPLPPPIAWGPMIAVAVACLILGAAIDHQWMLSRYANVVPAPVAAGKSAGRPAEKPAPVAAEPAPKDAGRSDTEVAVGTPAPSVEPGRISIRSVPTGAAVTIDGKPAGRTPVTASALALAAHSVVIARPGYTSETRRVTLSARAPTTSIAVTLKPARRAAGAPAAATPGATTGSVAIDSRPRGARITIDGRAIGQTPASVPGLTPGQHSLRLELDGYKPLVTAFTVKAGETARVAVTLEIR